MVQQDRVRSRKKALSPLIGQTSNDLVNCNATFSTCARETRVRRKSSSFSLRPYQPNNHKARKLGNGCASLCLVACILFLVYVLLHFASITSFPKFDAHQLSGISRWLTKKARKQVLRFQVTAGKSVNETACRDSALYFNMNKKEWGVFAKRNITVEDALAFKGPLWLIVEVVMSASDRPTPECEEFQDYFHLKPTDLIKKSGLRRSTHLNFSKETLKLLLVDGSDDGLLFSEYGHPITECIKAAASILGPSNVYVASRQLVVGRDLSQLISSDTLLSELNGTVFDYTTATTHGDEKKAFSDYIHNGVVAQWDFAIRPEYISVFHEIIRTKVGGMENSPVTFDDYFKYERHGDVAHFWGIEPDDPYGQFRNKVSRTVQEVITTYNFTGVVGLVSERHKIGRTTTSHEYAKALLDHKIVVVSQRDKWEGQYRLMEALMSGAMVMSDPITFPPVGVVDRETIVIYNSLQELAENIRYYLQDTMGEVERVHIAKSGQKIALEYHQPQQRFERLLLGDNFPSDWRNPVAPVIDCNS